MSITRFLFMICLIFTAVSGCREEKVPVTILFTSDVNGRIKAFG